jgi:hypothetical protein
MTPIVAFTAVAAGFALCWFTKDKITVLVTGAESYIRALEAKVAALKAAL